MCLMSAEMTRHMLSLEDAQDNPRAGVTPTIRMQRLGKEGASTLVLGIAHPARR